MEDPHDLDRFVQAQQTVYRNVKAELQAGRKTTHWMWFIFPQLHGLGHSAMAQRYAIASRQEAEAYLRHPLLGKRLQECTALVNAVQGRSVQQILGAPDDLKFHSCMTLFAAVAPVEPVFAQALQQYFAGARDPATLALL